MTITKKIKYYLQNSNLYNKNLRQDAITSTLRLNESIGFSIAYELIDNILQQSNTDDEELLVNIFNQLKSHELFNYKVGSNNSSIENLKFQKSLGFMKAYRILLENFQN